jgi:Mut7-C ubiquitin/Mut7-C RNAse domain
MALARTSRMQHAGEMDTPNAEIRFAAELRMFLAPRRRAGSAQAAGDGMSTLGHVIESLGVPLPEVGGLMLNGRPELRPGTRRSYQAYSRCPDCGRVYWRGAHSQWLQRVVDSALAAVAASGDA